jgi:hypothetical protein
MAKLFGQHWPHLIFVVVGVAAFLWTAYRPDRDGSREKPRSGAAPAAAKGRPEVAKASVRRTVARRSLVALGPLVGAAATGAILYGLDLGGSAVPGAAAWVHSGISLLALLLVAYKVADLGLARMRRAFTRQRLPELASIILGPAARYGRRAAGRTQHALLLCLLTPDLERVVDRADALAPEALSAAVAARGRQAECRHRGDAYHDGAAH